MEGGKDGKKGDEGATFQKIERGIKTLEMAFHAKILSGGTTHFIPFPRKWVAPVYPILEVEKSNGQAKIQQGQIVATTFVQEQLLYTDEITPLPNKFYT